MNDNREAARIPIEKLPELLRGFTIRFGFREVIRVDTYDASTKGLGFTSPYGLDHFQIGDHVVLDALDESFRLIGEVRYISQKSENKNRVGLIFKKTKTLKEYHDRLTG
jgi:hypothetical protein